MKEWDLKHRLSLSLYAIKHTIAVTILTLSFFPKCLQSYKQRTIEFMAQWTRIKWLTFWKSYFRETLNIFQVQVAELFSPLVNKRVFSAAGGTLGNKIWMCGHYHWPLQKREHPLSRIIFDIFTTFQIQLQPRINVIMISKLLPVSHLIHMIVRNTKYVL